MKNLVMTPSKLFRTMLTIPVCFFLFVISPVKAEPPSLHIAVLKYGTVNWELNVIKHHKLDKKNGFQLKIQDVAGQAAAKIAFQGNTADLIVSDWIWVARQRAGGKAYQFIPYSRSVGGLMVPADAKIGSLIDLKGRKIGIAGGPLDKSWLLMRALTQKLYGFDLADHSEAVFGAPPLIYKKALQGELAGAINFWHFTAKMEAAGMRRLISIDEVAKGLGLDPDTPLLGYIVKDRLVSEQPELIAGFIAASQAAKRLLANNDAEWDRLRPIMKVKTDTEFSALKAGFRSGIPSDDPVDKAAAGRLLAVMARLGGRKLVGTANSLPKGVFYSRQQ